MRLADTIVIAPLQVRMAVEPAGGQLSSLPRLSSAMLGKLTVVRELLRGYLPTLHVRVDTAADAPDAGFTVATGLKWGTPAEVRRAAPSNAFKKWKCFRKRIFSFKTRDKIAQLHHRPVLYL